MEKWKRGHLVVDESDDRIVLERNELLIMANRANDSTVSELILSDVHVLDAVDDIILNMMAA